MQDLIRLLREQPRNSEIPELVAASESQSTIELDGNLDLLTGVWELRWSSAKQPWLKQADWLENLQVLDPENARGMNLLQLAGPLGSVAAIAVEFR